MWKIDLNFHTNPSPWWGRRVRMVSSWSSGTFWNNPKVQHFAHLPQQGWINSQEWMEFFYSQHSHCRKPSVCVCVCSHTTCAQAVPLQRSSAWTSQTGTENHRQGSHHCRTITHSVQWRDCFSIQSEESQQSQQSTGIGRWLPSDLSSAEERGF